MTRYFVNYKLDGKKRHSEYKNFQKAKNDAVRLNKDERYESVHVLVADFDSEGKLHQVVYNLCLAEAEKRGRLPLGVLFIDQEAEWQATIDYVRSIMYDERVKPYWLQVYIRLFNASSHESDNWLHCWKPGDDWMREKDPISIKENVYGTDRFKELFGGFMKHEFPDGRTCFVAGVRAEESPNRRSGLTGQATYKDITWGKKEGPSYTFYPIYDWAFSDVWHAICSEKWRYNKVYDYMYQFGVKPNTFDMRVSNLNHETALKSLYQVQEIEPETWNKMTARMNGIETARNIEYSDAYKAPRELPFMFKSWAEYRDYLLDNLVTDAEQRKLFKDEFQRKDSLYMGDSVVFDRWVRSCISAIFSNDYTFTKLGNFESRGEIAAYRNIRKGRGAKKETYESVYCGSSVKALVQRIEDARQDNGNPGGRQGERGGQD